MGRSYWEPGSTRGGVPPTPAPAQMKRQNLECGPGRTICSGAPVAIRPGLVEDALRAPIVVVHRHESAPLAHPAIVVLRLVLVEAQAHERTDQTTSHGPNARTG